MRKARTRSRVGRTLAAAVMATTLVVTTASPARADEAGNVMFTGKLYVNPAMWLPPFGPPGNGTWLFASDSANWPLNLAPGCVADSASTKKTTPANAGPCGLTMNGGLMGQAGGAYCGSSIGLNGTGTLVVGPQRYDLNNVGWTQSAGTSFVISGSITKRAINGQGPGNFSALVQAVPDLAKVPTGQVPCVTWGVTRFYMAGAGSFTI